jgi:hypothetical protein
LNTDNQPRIGAFLAATAAATLSLGLALPAAAERHERPEPVTVVNTPTVQVTNADAAPLFVDTGPSARKAVSSFCDAFIDPATGNTSCTLTVVPPGRILTMESILCFAHVPVGVAFNSILLTMAAPNPSYPAAGVLATINHFLTMTPTPNGDYGGNHSYMLTTPIKLYSFGVPASSGSTSNLPVTIDVQIGSFTPPAAAPQFGCTMAGTLEDQ